MVGVCIRILVKLNLIKKKMKKSRPRFVLNNNSEEAGGE